MSTGPETTRRRDFQERTRKPNQLEEMDPTQKTELLIREH